MGTAKGIRRLATFIKRTGSMEKKSRPRERDTQDETREEEAWEALLAEELR